MGYIQAGRPIEIPHISWNIKGDSPTICIAKEATEEEVQSFKQKLASFDEKHIRFIKHLPLGDTVLLGVQAGLESNIEYYIASQDGKTHPFTSSITAGLAAQISSKSTFTGADRYHVRTYQTATIDGDYFRCCAKIAFNALAHLKGQTLVIHKCFDPIRSWIVNGGDNQFVELAINQDTGTKQIFPENSHYVLITKVGERLIADVCFYNHFHHTVYLANNFTEDWHLEGFVCDWQMRKEYNFHEFLAKLASQQ